METSIIIRTKNEQKWFGSVTIALIRILLYDIAIKLKF